jgi:hypothetical protein
MVPAQNLLTDILFVTAALFILATAFDFFRQLGATLAESAAYSILSVVMLFSWIGQLSVLTGWTGAYWMLLGICLLASAIRLVWCFGRFQSSIRSAYRFFSGHRLAASGLMLAWGYVAIVSFLGIERSSEPGIAFWSHVPETIGSLLNLETHSLPVMNLLVFSAPFQPTCTLPLVHLAAYLAIGFGTYALARRYAWPPMAITVALLTTGMPRILYQASSVGGELLTAAAALVAILALYRLVERPGAMDLSMLFSAAAFTVEGGKLCYLMVSVLIALSVVLSIRRHGRGWLLHRRQFALGPIFVGLAAMAVFLQLGIVGLNLLRGYPWIGSLASQPLVFNSEPLMGTVGNLLRYLLLSMEVPRSIDGLLGALFDVHLSTLVNSLYQKTVVALSGSAGCAAAFYWRTGIGHSLGWFGPVGFLMVLPALAYALWFGPRRLKATALAMIAYWLLIALIAAWQPANVRFMTPFFVCGGFFMAFFLPPWRLGQNGAKLLQVLGFLQIIHILLL